MDAATTSSTITAASAATSDQRIACSAGSALIPAATCAGTKDAAPDPSIAVAARATTVGSASASSATSRVCVASGTAVSRCAFARSTMIHRADGPNGTDSAVAFASTSTVRLCASSGTNPFAAIAAGVACLWGPAHGGANEAALNMLYDIQREGGVAKIGEFITKVKDKNSSVRLMGFGHRVYKNYDPRAKLMRETCHEVLRDLGLGDDPLFKLAMALEKIALEDEYFVSRRLYPNVDFYSGLIYEALQFPPEMFTVLFAIGRTPGWLAQWLELTQDKEQKIARPKQIYTGDRGLTFVPAEQRWA